MPDVNFTESEQVVIAYVLNHPDRMFECSDLKADNFFNPANKSIFETMTDIQKNGKDIILPTVLDHVDEALKSYVIDLYQEGNINKTVFLMHLRYLIEKTNRLNIVQSLKDIITASEDPEFDVYKGLSNIEITRSVDEKRDFKTEVLKRLEVKMKNEGKTENILTGLSELDEVVGGFAKGCFYIIAGRSSMGKSAFMTSVCEHIEKSKKVGIVSLEMTGEEIYNRVACVRTNIPYWVIERGRATGAQFDRFASAVYSLKNIFLTDKGGLNGFEVISQIRRFVLKNKCDIVFIDHLGIINLDDKLNRAHAIGKLTSSLKSLSKELDIPIVSLCQVNRSVETKESKRPRLSDLRDSGRIEEDADCVILLYRPQYYMQSVVKEAIESMELIVSKNRNGECRTIECQFNGPLMKLSDRSMEINLSSRREGVPCQ